MDAQTVSQRFHLVAPFLDERIRRLFAAAEAKVLGYGGVTSVAKATGVSRRAIGVGLKELADPHDSPSKRIRRPGAGRKRVVDQDAALRSDLENLVEPVTQGDPESPLRWTCKSVRLPSASRNEQVE